MCRPPSCGRVRRRACGLPYQASGQRSRRVARLLFDRCATAPETRPLLAVSRAHPSCVQRRPMGGGGDSPARRPGAPAVLGVPLPSMLIVLRRRWGPVISQERRQVRPVIAPPLLPPPTGDPTPITQVKVRTRRNRLPDYRFLTFQTGSRL